MASITLSFKPRGKRLRSLPKDLSFAADTPIAAIYKQLSDDTGLSVYRLRCTNSVDNKVLDNTKEDATVESAGLKDGGVVFVKDLGPQLGWRTVYIIEYLGPLLMHPLFLYYLRPYLYPSPRPLPPATPVQELTCWLLILHFIKRELETIYIHQFSLATMPARNIFRNSAHYWLLSGLNIAYWVYRPNARAARSPTAGSLHCWSVYLGLVLFVFGELANFNTHLTLKKLRKPGSKAREIPRGFGFGLVTCPNYFFEVVAWIGIFFVSGMSLSVLVFTSVGFATMFVWAKGKERRYRKLFGDRYKKKKNVMVPFVM